MTDEQDWNAEGQGIAEWNAWGVTKDGKPVEWGDWGPSNVMRWWGVYAVLQQRWQRTSKNLMLKKYPDVEATQIEWRRVPHVEPTGR